MSVNEVTIGNLVVKVEYDDFPTNPRDDDQLGIMVCWYPGHTLGDEQFAPGDMDGAHDMREVGEYIQRERGGLNLIPLYVYEHSGITISAGATIEDVVPEITARGVNPFDSAGWDTTAVGYIYTTEERIAELGTPREYIDEALRGEVTEYAAYLEGQVFTYSVERHTDPTCDDDDCTHHVEDVDSCGGFYDDADALSEGIDVARYEYAEAMLAAEVTA